MSADNSNVDMDVVEEDEQAPVVQELCNNYIWYVDESTGKMMPNMDSQPARWATGDQPDAKLNMPVGLGLKRKASTHTGQVANKLGRVGNGSSYDIQAMSVTPLTVNSNNFQRPYMDADRMAEYAAWRNRVVELKQLLIETHLRLELPSTSLEAQELHEKLMNLQTERAALIIQIEMALSDATTAALVEIAQLTAMYVNGAAETKWEHALDPEIELELLEEEEILLAEQGRKKWQSFYPELDLDSLPLLPSPKLQSIIQRQAVLREHAVFAKRCINMPGASTLLMAVQQQLVDVQLELNNISELEEYVSVNLPGAEQAAVPNSSDSGLDMGSSLELLGFNLGASSGPSSSSRSGTSDTDAGTDSDMQIETPNAESDDELIREHLLEAELNEQLNMLFEP
ncbi:maker340 [Drosophila busckii]|uniref:Maker340 n=1 Tax=Drosophila busckii TaxID=30019 RepID=A0A0M4ESZ4_DROBS|nr:uncharacterized protein LOC108605432 [Drosophila busckii]ALC49515.1 maker340 [Drosophila busckii]